MSPKSPDNIFAKLWRAFTWHWHLLGLGGAATLAVLSGGFFFWLPFLMALEIAYLGFLGLQPRFQRILKIMAKPQTPPPLPQSPQLRLQQLLNFLPAEDTRRYESLRSRCLQLLSIRGAMNVQSLGSAEDFRSESLDNMLWLFLKLLRQRAGLEKFLQTTPREAIESDLKAAQAKLDAAQSRSDELPDSRLVSTIRERLSTIQERLSNHKNAQNSIELISEEIDKTEQQITHLCETGMTSADSAGLTAQIDTISQSLRSAEEVFGGQAGFDLFLDNEKAPPLLSGREAIGQ